MKFPALRYIGLLILSIFFSSCNLGRWVPEGKYRLKNIEIQVNGEDAPSEVYSIAKQTPTPPFPNMVYSWGNPTDTSGFSKWVSEQGTAPVVYSDILAQRTAQQLGYYYFNQGYFLNSTSYSLEVDSNHQDVEVTYVVHLGTRYNFNNLEYDINSPQIAEVVAKYTNQSVIKKGEPYMESTLGEERDRLNAIFRNDGFFGFSKSLIRFTADTTEGNYSVNLTMRILDQPVRTQDTTYTVEHQRYTIDHVYIDYDFSYQNPNPYYGDSLTYNNYEFLLQGEENYHPHLITRAVHFEPGEPFREKVIQDSYTHLSSLGVFGASEIEFKRSLDTTENKIDAYVKLSPLQKRSITYLLEATNTSGFYGIAGNIGLLHRNTFGAGEILDISLEGGIQAQFNTFSSDAESGLFNTYEIGAEAGISFSRFLFPVSWQRRFPKRIRPSTRLFTSINQQTRPEFQRRIMKVGATFSWIQNDNVKWQLSMPEFSYVNLIDFEPSYVNSLFFKTGFQDNLIASISITRKYEPVNQQNRLSRQYFRWTFESSGNLLSLMDGGFAVSEETGQKIIFDVPYAQYLKFDADYRHYLKTGPKSVFVSRAFLGITYNYGNSPFLPPFEKNYLAGGSQDIRGWIAYRLGPGQLPKNIYDDQTYAAVAPLKAIVNLEHRFPILGNLYGATFIDAGNIWLFDRAYREEDLQGLTPAEIESAKFSFDRLLQSSALGTGVGLRYDFGFFQLRMDGGIKVWDPSEPEGYRFVLNGLQWRTVTYNFALGYPF